MRYSKIIVSTIVALNAVFAAAVLYVFLRTSAEPTVLVGSWFGFTTTELWALSKIKRSDKNVKETDKS